MEPPMEPPRLPRQRIPELSQLLGEDAASPLQALGGDRDDGGGGGGFHWTKYKKELIFLNDDFQATLLKVKDVTGYKQRNIELMEILEKEKKICYELEVEIEELKKNRIYKEELATLKNKYNVLFTAKNKSIFHKHELTMKIDELNIMIASLQRSIEVFKAQMKGQQFIHTRYASELKIQLKQFETIILRLRQERDMYIEHTRSLDAELAEYRRHLSTLKLKETWILKETSLEVKVLENESDTDPDTKTTAKPSGPIPA